MKDAIAAALWLNAVQILTAICFFAVPVMAPAIAVDLGVETTLKTNGSETAKVDTQNDEGTT